MPVATRNGATWGAPQAVLPSVQNPNMFLGNDVSINADGTTLVEARPVTGRTNQIRIHLWDVGYPIVGDLLYLPDKRTDTSRTLVPGEPPMCLHSRRIEFNHPLTGERIAFEAPVPAWAGPSHPS